MRKMRWLILVVPLVMFVAFFANDGATENESGIMNLQTILVDDFDLANTWKVKYSKFRSPKYNTFTKVDKDHKSVFESNYEWLKSYCKEDIYGYAPDGSALKINETFFPEGLPKSVRQNQRCILGVKSKFDFKGYNWFAIEPKNLKDNLAADADSVDDPIEIDSTDERKTLMESAADKSEALPLGRLSKGDPEITLEEYKIVAPEGAVEGGKVEPILVYANGQEQDDYLRGRNFQGYIQLVGKVQAIDVWVWGMNYNYNLEMHIKDLNDTVHVLPVGNLKFKGWRNLRVNIPKHIPQKQDYIPFGKPLKFLRFKVVTNPTERTDNYKMYLDYMQSLSDIFEEGFPGDRLSEISWDADATN